MADGNRAAVRIHAAVVERDAQPFQARQHLRGERFVDLDDVHVLDGEPGARQRFFRCGNRADAHDAAAARRRRRWRSCARSASTPALSPASWMPTISATAPSLTPEALPAVVTPPSYSGFILASASMSTVGTRMLVVGDRRHRAFARGRQFNRGDFAGEKALAFGDRVFLLRGQRELVGFLALDARTRARDCRRSAASGRRRTA